MKLAAAEEAPTTPVGALGTTVVVLDGPLARADITGLCERASALLEASGAGLLVCDVGGIEDPDAQVVEALARVALSARRRGARVRLRHASRELRELLDLVGLGEVVGL